MIGCSGPHLQHNGSNSCSLLKSGWGVKYMAVTDREGIMAREGTEELGVNMKGFRCHVEESRFYPKSNVELEWH